MNRLLRHLERSRNAARGIAEGRMRRDRKDLRSESGAALVEFALAASLILCLFFGVIQFGYALYTYQYVNELARALTRYAIVRGNECGDGMPNCGFTDANTTLKAHAQSSYSYPGINTTKLTVTSTWYAPSTTGVNPTWSVCASACNAPGDMVKVTVTYPFLLNIPFWSGTTLQVKSSSMMVISQ